jgi:hypothetical protein
LRGERMMNVAGNHEELNERRSVKPATAFGRVFRRGRRLSLGRWALLTLIIAIFFSMGHFAGAYQKEQDILRIKSISAEKFEVRGPDDKLKASLFQGPRGEVYLAFFDQNGGARLSVGVGPRGTPIISFFDDKLSLRMSLSLDTNDGTPQVVLFDGHVEPALHLGITKKLGPDLSVGRFGQGRISISARDGGSPAIQVLDEKNNPRISLDLSDNNTPTISLLGENRVVRGSWRLHTDGSVIFSMSDPKSRQRLVVMTDKDGKPSIRFIDPDKNEARGL